MIDLLRALFGVHGIDDGSTCRVSARWWDVHDYHVHQGGDGFPSSFYVYQCPRCGRKFGI